MKTSLIVIFTLLLVKIQFGQGMKNSGEFRVINMLGAKVYEAPTFESKELTKLPLGKAISAEKIFITDEQFVIGNAFSLTGDWIKPKHINGFVFSADLTNKKVEIGKRDYGQTFINLLGVLSDQGEEEKLVTINDKAFSKHIEYKYYENGTYTYVEMDGCFDHLTEYKNLDLNEVYHQMISDYGDFMDENEFWIPVFQEKSGNTIKFEVEQGASQDLKIELRDNGIIIVSSYDCT